MANRNWSSPSWKMEVGLNHAPAYEVSGRPYASGAINAVEVQCVINFPYVTRWIEVVNDSSASLKVGWGPNAFAVDNNNYFTIPTGSTSGRLELKVNRLYLSGGIHPPGTGMAAAEVTMNGGTSVVAGLTSIAPDKVNMASGSATNVLGEESTVSINWSGSYSGVS